MSKLENYKGYNKIAIKGYKSSTGAVSNVVLDVSTKYGEAKEQDVEILKEHKDVVEVKDISSVVPDDKYDDLYVEAYDALYVSLTKAHMTKPRPETKINEGVSKHNDTGVIYVDGFLVEREEVKPSDKPKRVSKKRNLTLFKEHFKKDFLTEKYKRYKIENASYDLDGDTLTITIL